MVDITIDDVQNVYGDKPPAIDEDARGALVEIAESLTDNRFGGTTTRTSIIVDDDEDFAVYLAAHLWEITEGGEAQSQSQAGGSVNYAHLQGNIDQTLTETRFGRVCKMMMKDKASTGIVRADF